ncbi:MAG: ABC transporter ATP-binding protein [Gammaproteobacteria bacterium]|nr:ABC transporter ATP-binding protein [Gammaproteobacteria bacterium]
MSEVALQAHGLTKSFTQGPSRIDVLTGADLRVGAGERVAVIGRSGSGKSTLLHLLAGLDDPDSGHVMVGERNLTTASQAVRAQIRNTHMGFVYQFHHLLPEFSALENVALPLRLGGMDPASAGAEASALLGRVGLQERLDHRPAALSGGERQRVAVARALIGEPLVVLADEPTGNLDRENAEQIFALMCELSDERGVGFVVVTHDEGMLMDMHRVLKLEGGQLT